MNGLLLHARRTCALANEELRGARRELERPSIDERVVEDDIGARERLHRAYREELGIAIDSLLANRLRASLTTLGIVIGIVTVVLMITLIQGLQRAFMREVAGIGSHTLYVQKLPWMIQGDFFKYRNRPNLTQREADALAQVPGVAAVVPHVITARAVTYGDRKARLTRLTERGADFERAAFEIIG